MDETIDILNKRLYTQFKKQISSTFAAAKVKNDGSVTLYNAGSPGWIIVSEDDEKGSFLGLRSNPLGVSMETNSAKKDLEVKKGSTVFTFTDGIWKVLEP